MIGGGPAGTAAAYRLARLGHDVILIERNMRPRPRMIESLPPSILPLLAFLDLTGYVEGCLRLRSRGTVIRWDDATPQFRARGEDDAFLVNRTQFDESLLTAASDVGVRILRPAIARRPRATGDGWKIEVMGHGVRQVIHAAFLVIASGKNSSLARPRRQLSACTIALAARWRNSRLDEPVMLVDVGKDCWCWGCSLPGGTVHAAVFLDRDRCPVGGQAGLKALWGRLLAESPLMARHVHGEPEGLITVHDATPYRADSFAGPRFVRIGDAAVTLDPLSSQGVQTALSMALQGSLVVHTIRTIPANTTAAVGFYESRCGELVARHQHQTARLYSQQTVYLNTDFWHRRRGAAESISIDAHVTAQRRHVIADLATDMRYRIADETQLVELPAATGDIISLQLSLVHPSLQRPLTYLDDLLVAQLLSEFSREGALISDVIDRFSRSDARQKYAHAICLLIAIGVLIPEPYR